MARSEEWRAVPGLDNFVASSEGRIALVKNGVAEIRGHGCNGYVGVCTPGPIRVTENLTLGCPRTSKRYYRVYAHHLIALAFIGPPPNDDQIQINHKDTDKANNRPGNLEWTTQGENVQHAWDMGTRKRVLYKYTEQEYKNAFGLRMMGMQYKEIARLTGMNIAGVPHAVKYSRYARRMLNG